MSNIVKNINYFLPFAIIFIALGVLLDVSMSTKKQNNPQKISSIVPDFELKSIFDSGEDVSRKDILGTPAILYFWSTDCSECLFQHSSIVDLHKTIAYPIYGINYKDSKDRVLKWLDKNDNPYLYSINDNKGDLALDFNVFSVPQIIVIDEFGNIRYRHIGYIDNPVDKDYLLKVLEDL